MTSTIDADMVRGHWSGFEYHTRMLDDAMRMDAYDRAIRALVRPGMTLLDLGCGTGVLAMLAAKRGARVHAVESTPMARIARDLIAHNGLSSQITVYEADACEMAPVEPVDGVISDFLGRFLVDDGMMDAVTAARAWLKPGGFFCPGKVLLRAAPLAVPVLPVEVISHPRYGLDLSPAMPYVLRGSWSAQVHASALASDPADVALIRPELPDQPIGADLHFKLRAGRITGLLGWFAAELAPGVILDTGPGADTHWGQQIFALPPTDVVDGDTLDMALLWGDDRWSWTGRLAGKSFALSSDIDLGKRSLAIGPPPVLGKEAALAAHELALAAFAEKNYEAAAIHWERAVAALTPADDHMACALYENLGLARGYLGHHSSAAQHFFRALDGDDNSRPQSRECLHRMYAADGRGFLARRFAPVPVV